jgi:acyl-[acyl-carrier-protein]-phospholipid O-acyltransferase/long-chain-fatty-acid--[acyl-carrier-protein] ligase
VERKPFFQALSWLEEALRWTLESILRIFLWLLVHTIYRIRLLGRENVPRQGPALLVCNHVTWLDGLFVMMSQRRRIRFLVWAPYTQLPVLRWLFWLVRAIPISGESGTRAIVKALREASRALGNGELVCIFAEGALTRTGFLLPFQRGFEQIVRKTPAPIIPICLDRLWGSVFSYQGGRFFWKWPQKIPFPVTVAFGKPLPTNIRAWQVRLAVQQLLADCFILRKSHRKPAHRQFVRMACRHPFRRCMIDYVTKGPKLNYGKALTAAILLSRKLRPKLGNMQMIGLLLPTVIGGALANIAVALMGKTAVNLNYTASREAILSAIRQCHIRHVVSSRAFRNKLKLDLGPDVEVIDLEDIMGTITTFQKLRTYLGIVCLPGFITEYVTLGLGQHRSDDVATVIFSSGTTGDPKGVVLNHNNIVANMESVSQAVDLLPSDRVMAVLPFFHSFGYTITLWLPLLIGASIVYYPDPRQAKDIADLCKRYKCTLFLSTPTFLRFFVRRADPDSLASLRLLICGAEKLPQVFAQEFKDKFGIFPLEGYGCTELSPVASVNVPDRGEEGFREIGTKAGTVGRVIPGVAARIVHPDTFADLPPGQDGLLLVYGPNVMTGYLNRPEATREVIKDGWYVTGDIARIDEEGFISITDRLSRFSKVGGEMVPHLRVEEELHSILGTTERICAVTGVPDERKGERLVVLYTPLNGFDVKQLRERLAERGLPNLWLPGPKSYFAVPELPILGSGKLDLQKVKRLAVEFAKQTSDDDKVTR